MAIPRRLCVNHPQRPAIGICVITHAAICGECSTRYEGVNYSKEGLEILHRQRGTNQKKTTKLIPMLAWLLSPVMLYLLYLGYSVLASILTDMLHRDL
jgi:predicted nucleic acid-binding Zn ribbon protein